MSQVPKDTSLAALAEWATDQRTQGGNVFAAILAASQARRQASLDHLCRRNEAHESYQARVREAAAAVKPGSPWADRRVRELLDAGE